MGMNGFQYINDSNSCMLCDQPELCSSCEDTRHLPWTQEYGNDIWDEGEAFIDCGLGDVNLGDVNLDGVVNILDIVQTVNYILGNLIFTPDQILQADFNQDSDVNILDIVQTVNHILNDDGCFENGEYDDGEEFTDIGVVWDMWEITLRDLVILDRDGRYVTRINLTSTNPDPNSTCGENYETIKELLISIRNQ